MTLLAEGTLRAASFGVAKQAASLPSSSTSKAEAPKAKAVEKEAEGGTFVGEQASDVVSLASNLQTDPVEATQTHEDDDAQTVSSAERVGEQSQEVLADSKETERERLENITQELEKQLNTNLSLKFGQDEETGKDVIQLVEKDTGDIVQQIPPQAVLDFVEKFNDFAGLIFNEDA